MTYAQVFFGWLLQTTLIASLVICLILLIQKILGTKLGPRWSHALWLVLLIRMILPWAPSSRVSLSNLISPWERQIQNRQQNEPIEQKKISAVEQKTVTSEARPSQEVESEAASQKPVVPKPPMAAEVEGESKLRLVSLRRVLPILWLAGAIVIGVYLLISDLTLWRIVKRDRPLMNQPILEIFEECKAQMGIQSLVVVVPSDNVRSPGLFGFVRPRLLLPRQMLYTATHEEMRYVFLHELAHLKRHDIYLGWLASLLQILHWFNPLIWFAFYRMRADRELACDALVLTRTGQDKSQEYGSAILGLVRRFSRSRPLPAMAGVIESKSQLKRRIAMITQFKNKSYRWSPLAAILIIILACISLPNAKRSQAADATAVEVPAGGDRQQGPIIRELKIDMIFNTTFSLSRDGDKVVYWKITDGRRDRRNLVVRNLISGDDTQITHHPAGKTWTPVFSPDGNRVVYTWEGGRAPHSLHTVSLQTGEVRCLNVSGFPMDWSRDGRFILLSTAGKVRDCILSLDGDTVEKVDLPIPKESSGWRFSADSKYVSYSHNGNLYLYNLGDKEVTQVTKGSHEDTQPIWSPDGNTLLFLGRRGFGPQPDLCYVAIADGKVAGNVRVVRPDLGDDVELYSLSDRGQLLYRRNLEDTGVRVTELDPYTGQPTGEPVQLAAGSHPIWSPDGKQIAYTAKRVLHVMSADGTNDQEIISVNFPDTGTYAWSADGDHIYIQELRKGGIETCAISISTKERRTVLPADPRINATHLTCSPDGKHLSFLKHGPPSGKNQVFIVDVDGANLRQLTFYEDGYVYYPAWSPDGKQIAVEYGPGSGIKTLSLVSVDDGTTTELFRGDAWYRRFYRKSWSPDGSKIAWAGASSYIYIGQVSEGKFDRFYVGDILVIDCCWSPDGKKMLFWTGSDIRQLMIIENFLPEGAGK